MDLGEINTPIFDEPLFAEDAVYAPAVGDSKTIRVILSVAPGQVSLGGGVAPQIDKVSALVRKSDVTGIKTKDRLTVDGKTYAVAGILDDLTGCLSLDLSEVIA